MIAQPTSSSNGSSKGIPVFADKLKSAYFSSQYSRIEVAARH